MRQGFGGESRAWRLRRAGLKLDRGIPPMRPRLLFVRARRTLSCRRRGRRYWKPVARTVGSIFAVTRQEYLQRTRDRSRGADLPVEKRKERLKKKKGNKPQFDLRASLFRMVGADLTLVDGIDVMTAMTILSEAGCDMSKWETENHFVSWLRLCPDNRISGEKIIGKGRLPTNNRATLALKMAASSLRTSQTYLGAQFRRLRTKLGAPVAIKAMAAKLARVVYRMLRYGISYIDKGMEFYEAQHRKLQINHLKWKASQLGFQIVEAPTA